MKEYPNKMPKRSTRSTPGRPALPANKKRARQVWPELLRLAIRNPGIDGDEPAEIEAARLVVERESAVRSLRMLYKDFGDSHWSDDLYL